MEAGPSMIFKLQCSDANVVEVKVEEGDSLDYLMEFPENGVKINLCISNVDGVLHLKRNVDVHSLQKN